MTINRNLANLASAVVSTGGNLATANLSGTITNSQLAGSITSDKISSITSSHVTTALGFTPGTGSVTSVATGNGLAGGTITSSGTLTLGSVTHDSVGCYASGKIATNVGALSMGSTFAGGSFTVQNAAYSDEGGAMVGTGVTSTLSGTYRYVGIAFGGNYQVLAVRVS